jgi:phosphoacetylglucosamine mutase
VLVPVATAIDDPAALNAHSGADYVKTGQKLPPVFLPPSEHALESGTLACSFDGDADRIIFYYLDQSGAFKLLDGDKQAALSAGFLVDLVQQAGLNSRDEGEGSVDVGVVQTAYANGSSTRYLREVRPSPRRAEDSNELTPY